MIILTTTRLYSEKKESSSDKKKKRKKKSDEFIENNNNLEADGYSEEDPRRLIASGVSAGIIGNRLSKKLHKSSYKSLINSKNNHPDEDKVRKALLDKAESQGIEVIPEKGLGNAAYTGLRSGKKIKDGLEKITGVDLDYGLTKHLGKDRIIYDPNNKALSSSTTLAHELGHAQYGGEVKRSKDFIARTAHDLTPINKAAVGGLGIIGSAINGYRSGIKSEEAKEKGEKESNWNKVRSIAVPAALVSPLLISEASASVKGLKMLKEAGADKEMLADSRKTLGSAFGTYAAKALIPVIAGAAGRVVGKGVARLRRSRKKKESNKEKK